MGMTTEQKAEFYRLRALYWFAMGRHQTEPREISWCAENFVIFFQMMLHFRN